jgi:hypothetical protein
MMKRVKAIDFYGENREIFVSNFLAPFYHPFKSFFENSFQPENPRYSPTMWGSVENIVLF